MAAALIFRSTLEDVPSVGPRKTPAPARPSLSASVPKPRRPAVSRSVNPKSPPTRPPGTFVRPLPGCAPSTQEFVPSWMCASATLKRPDCIFNFDNFSEYHGSDDDTSFALDEKVTVCSNATLSETEAGSESLCSEPDADAGLREHSFVKCVAEWVGSDSEDQREADALQSTTTASDVDGSDTEQSASNAGETYTSAVSSSCSQADPVELAGRVEPVEEAVGCGEPLAVSLRSWSAQQRLRRLDLGSGCLDASDEEVRRRSKAILNKLTFEKFDELYAQLTCIGIQTVTHVDQLIEDIFERAATQHHFIDLYADLVLKLSGFFAEHPALGADIPQNFRKILLRACQSSFEKYLAPPNELDALDSEERSLLEFMYKQRMLGNLQFLGALLVRKILSRKVILAIMEELLSNPSPEATESLAALLTAVGPSIESSASKYRAGLNAIFADVKRIVKTKDITTRTRCLLADVLDLRAAGWNDNKPKRIDIPTTLSAVAEQEAREEGLGAIILEAQRKAQKRVLGLEH